MATQTIIQPYYAGSLLHAQPTFWGGPEYPNVKETASQSYGIGDLLYFDSNGTIAIATVDGGTPTLLNTAVAGQAVKAATGTTGASVLFRVIRNDDLFFITVGHATASSAVTALTDVGDVRGIAKYSGYWRLSIDADGESASLANGDMSILGLPLRHPVGGVTIATGDVAGLFLAKFNTWSIASDGNPNRRVLQMSG